MAQEATMTWVLNARDETQGAIKSASGGLTKFAKMAAVGATAAVVGFAALAKSSIDAASALEQQEVAFKTLLGSQEKSVSFLKEVQQFAAKTPFETKDITQAAQTMLAFGADVKTVMPNIQMIGDVALGNKEKFASLSLSFSQVQATGKLMGQDLMQMVNQGFNPLQIMAEKSGKSMAVLKDEMAAGKISAEMVTQAFKDATSEGGRFFGGMEAQSTTLAGLVSTLQDTWSVFLQGSGKLLMQWAKELVIVLTGFVQNVLPIVIEKADQLMQTVSGLAKQFTDWTQSMNITGESIMGIKDRFFELIAVFDQQTGIITAVKDAFNSIWSTITGELMPALAQLWEALKPWQPYFQAVAKLFGTILVAAIRVFIEVLKLAITTIVDIVTWIAKAATAILNFGKGAIEPATKFVNGLTSGIKTAVTWLKDMYNWLVSASAKANNLARSVPLIGPVLASMVPGKASGGPVTGNSPYLVGEEGPELFIPRQGGSIVPNNKMGGIGGGDGMVVNITFNGDVTDRDTLMRQVVEAVNRAASVQASRAAW